MSHIKSYLVPFDVPYTPEIYTVSRDDEMLLYRSNKSSFHLLHATRRSRAKCGESKDQKLLTITTEVTWGIISYFSDKRLSSP